jgi:hypothetical protein
VSANSGCVTFCDLAANILFRAGSSFIQSRLRLLFTLSGAKSFALRRSSQNNTLFTARAMTLPAKTR